MATKPEFHDAVRSFVKSLKPAMKLVTAGAGDAGSDCLQAAGDSAEVNKIRGVDSSGVFGSLLARD